MNKSILLLINGFGVEKKDSVSIYSDKLMPNMDELTRKYLFSSLSTTAGDYNNGYRLFSMRESKKVEDAIDNMIYDKTLGKNEIIKNIESSLTDQNKLHIFYTLEEGDKLHQLREIVKLINPLKNKKVFIHIILMSTSINSYNTILKVINKISFETSEYCKIGFVVGKNKVNSDDTLRTIYKEFGEHWNESNKKFEILKNEIINPEDVNIFHINNGFSLGENDTILIMNFKNIELTRLYEDIAKMSLNMYSLYPFREDVKYIFERKKTNSISISDLVEKHNIKLLVLTDNSKINDINFYLNGMQKKLTQNISYAIMNLNLFSTKEAVINLMENYNFDGVIMDFDIGSYTKVEEIKDLLSKIDAIIKPISDATSIKNYTFIVSSTYGMYAQVLDGVVPKIVNFSGKVPCVFQSNEFTKSNYSLNSGTTISLGETFLTTICDDVKMNRLIHKLSKLDKMLSKK